MTATIAYSCRSTSFWLVNGGSKASIGGGVGAPLVVMVCFATGKGHNVRRMKRMVAFSERGSDEGLYGDVRGFEVRGVTGSLAAVRGVVFKVAGAFGRGWRWAGARGGMAVIAEDVDDVVVGSCQPVRC